VAEGAIGPAVALPLGKEGAELGQVPLVARLHPGHGLELHLRLGAGGGAHVLPVGNEAGLLGVEPGAVGVALGDVCQGVAGTGRSSPLLAQHLVPHGDGQPKLQVVDAHLADVLGLGAAAANLDAFPATLGPRLPGEDGEGDLADLALFTVWLGRHSQVGVVAEAGFAHQWEFRIFPFLFCGVSFDACHGQEVKWSGVKLIGVE